VLGPSVRQEIVKRFGNAEQDIDTLLKVAAGLNATIALRSSAETRNDSVILRAELFDVATSQLIRPAEARGPIEALDSLVSEIVLNALAEQAMQQATGYQASLPRGLEALSSYIQGVIQYRRGSYLQAVQLFDRVIELDPEYAPAHFNRMMAQMFGNRISRYPDFIGSALRAASAYRERLNPMEQRLLEGYEALLDSGDIWQAEEVASEIVDDDPNAVDAQFLLGYVQLNFRALLGRSVREAILPFSRAVQGDSSFAMALWHLATIATVDGDKAAAQEYFARLFAIDSTSMWSVAAQLGDSAVFKGTHMHVVQSISERSTDVVELISVWLGELDPPPGTHAVGEAALQEFRRRAATERDRRLAFRMYMANMLATGKFASAETLLRDGPGRRVPQDELDRWVVLSAVTPIHTLGSPTEVAESARRLLATQEDAESRWLAARWHLLRNNPTDARVATQSLERIANDSNRSTPLARSLAQDLEAVQYLALGDTTAADSLWREATRVYSVDDLMFGLTASLWPLRLQQAAAAAAREDTAAVLRTAATFQQMAGFVDQVGWPTILPLEAALDPLRARNIYIRLERLLSLADGEGEQLLEQVQRNLARLGG
jgi:tetratricopeptide (TPR) repeat protein